VSTLPPLLNAHRARAWALWLVPAVLLVLALGWETDWGREIVRVPKTPAPAEPRPVSAEVLPEYAIEGGLAGHAETVNRTLFNVTRRPAPTLAADNGPRQIAHGRYQLLGTAVTGEKNIAFLKDTAGGKTHVVRQGEELNGMTVAQVTADRVTFTVGDDSEELVLKVAPGPKTTLVAAPPPPGQAQPAASARPAPAAAAAAAAARAQQPAANPAAAAQPQQPQNPRAARRAARAAGGAPGGDAGGQAAQQRRTR
jgi:hypothetical protein